MLGLSFTQTLRKGIALDCAARDRQYAAFYYRSRVPDWKPAEVSGEPLPSLQSGTKCRAGTESNTARIQVLDTAGSNIPAALKSKAESPLNLGESGLSTRVFSMLTIFWLELGS